MRRFDKAVVSFSDCVWQLVCHMKVLDPNLEFPYRILPDRERIEIVQMATSRAPAAAAAHSAESSASPPADASYSLKCVLLILRTTCIPIRVPNEYAYNYPRLILLS